MHCYFCGGEATGVEHVPPKSFFIKGQREELITVPSCDVHNQQKSKDDEYIRSLLLSSSKLDGNEKLNPLFDLHSRMLRRAGEQISKRIESEEGYQKFFEIEERLKGDPIFGMKICSELQKAGISTGLLGLLSVDYRDEIILDSNGNEQKTISFKFDTERFINFFKALSKGIFFHETKTIWLGEVELLTHGFLREDVGEVGERYSQHYRSQLVREQAKGRHKDIFYYDIGTEVNDENAEILRYVLSFCLYDEYEFTAFFERHNLVRSVRVE
jgi:hypothetical protein